MMVRRRNEEKLQELRYEEYRELAEAHGKVRKALEKAEEGLRLAERWCYLAAGGHASAVDWKRAAERVSDALAAVRSVKLKHKGQS
jgi:hypothetical protein